MAGPFEALLSNDSPSGGAKRGREDDSQVFQAARTAFQNWTLPQMGRQLRLAYPGSPPRLM